MFSPFRNKSKKNAKQLTKIKSNTLKQLSPDSIEFVLSEYENAKWQLFLIVKEFLELKFLFNFMK